jgi:hypothetical protein
MSAFPLRADVIKKSANRRHAGRPARTRVLCSCATGNSTRKGTRQLRGSKTQGAAKRVEWKETATHRVVRAFSIRQRPRRAMRQQGITRSRKPCCRKFAGAGRCSAGTNRPNVGHPTEIMQVEPARLRTRQPTTGEDDLACLLPITDGKLKKLGYAPFSSYRRGFTPITDIKLASCKCATGSPRAAMRQCPR